MQQEYLDQTYTGKDSLPATFRDASFEGCTFIESDFKEFDLAHARFLDCTFKTCDLSNVNLGNARMRDVAFENCKLMGVVWTKLDDLTNPTFKSSILSYGNFSGLKLKKNAFTKCILHDADFAQADLSECDFSESDLLNARFDDTTLLKTDFQTAFNYLIDPLRNKVRGAKFSLPEAVGLLKGLGVVIK